MEFQYRYVPFGTEFTSVSQERGANSSLKPEEIGTNELVLDVGGVCWGHDGEERTVIDHHFHRDAGQFPSAAAAVLHSAARIHDRFAMKPLVWLVSHVQPDFDSFSAMYLARALLQPQGGRAMLPAAEWDRYGIHPAAWIPVSADGPPRRIDWYSPWFKGMPSERRWAVLLAAAASATDNCRPIACPRNRTLHSILYAAIKRGRNFDNPESGAREFFDEVREAIEDKGLHPLLDSVLEGSSTFAPELALLDREEATYARDISRARRTVVYVRRGPGPFHSWFPALQTTPLLDNERKLNPIHLCRDHDLVQVDGIFIRDPECLLFKEWARSDLDNAPMGQGFFFTAIAYSNGRPGAQFNLSEYYFALDPERAKEEGLHLYPVWARLQEMEARTILTEKRCESLVKELSDLDCPFKMYPGRRKGPRTGFEQRGGVWKNYFNDPWFDGINYECTIVPTPSYGTNLAPTGKAPNLSDDPIVHIAQQELEWVLFNGEFHIEERAASHNIKGSEWTEPVQAERDERRGIASGCYRLARIRVDPNVNFLTGETALQIGLVLWQRLDPDGALGIPHDFATMHLIRAADWVAVWNHHGVALASKNDPDVQRRVEEGSPPLFREIAELSAAIESFAETTPGAERLPALVEEGDSLMRRLVKAQHQLAMPEFLALERFFEAGHLNELMESLRVLNASVHQRERDTKRAGIIAGVHENIRTVALVQRKLEWLEVIFVSVYCAHLWHMIADKLLEEHHWIVSMGVLGAAVLSGIIMLIVLKPWRQHG